MKLDKYYLKHIENIANQQDYLDRYKVAIGDIKEFAIACSELVNDSNAGDLTLVIEDLRKLLIINEEFQKQFDNYVIGVLGVSKNARAAGQKVDWANFEIPSGVLNDVKIKMIESKVAKLVKKGLKIVKRKSK